MGMDVWVNVFTMPFLCADSGTWRKMCRAWPAMSAITTSSGSTCPSHQESAWGAAEARQERVIVEVVRNGIFGGRCWNILLNSSTNVFCQYCPRREGLRRGAVMRCQASWPPPTTKVDRKRTSKRRHHVWSVERFALCFSLSFLMSVHGCVGMDVWRNVLTMPLLCADSGPWRNLESCWKCWSMCWTHLQMFSVSTVLVEKASDVEQSWGSSAKLPGRRPPAHWIGRGQLNEGVMFGELRVLFFVLGVCLGGWEWMCEWMS